MVNASWFRTRPLLTSCCPIFSVVRQVRRAAAGGQAFRWRSIGGCQKYRFNPWIDRKKQRGFCSSQRRVDFNYTSSIPQIGRRLGCSAATARSSVGLCPSDDQLFESPPSGVASGHLGGDEEGAPPPPALELDALCLSCLLLMEPSLTLTGTTTRAVPPRNGGGKSRLLPAAAAVAVAAAAGRGTGRRRAASR